MIRYRAVLFSLLQTIMAFGTFAFIVFVIVFGWPPLNAQTSALGPITTTVTAGTSATLAALPANPTRRAVTICNGSATATATFTTGAVTPVSLTTGQVLQTGNVVASCFTISQIGSVGGNVGAAINVIASAASTPITFFEYP